MPRCPPPTRTHIHTTHTSLIFPPFHTASLVSACALLVFLFWSFFSPCRLVRRAVALRVCRLPQPPTLLSYYSGVLCTPLQPPQPRRCGKTVNATRNPRAHPFVILASSHHLLPGSPGDFLLSSLITTFLHSLLVLLHLSLPPPLFCFTCLSCSC